MATYWQSPDKNNIVRREDGAAPPSGWRYISPEERPDFYGLPKASSSSSSSLPSSTPPSSSLPSFNLEYYRQGIKNGMITAEQAKNEASKFASTQAKTFTGENQYNNILKGTIAALFAGLGVIKQGQNIGEYDSTGVFIKQGTSTYNSVGGQVSSPGSTPSGSTTTPGSTGSTRATSSQSSSSNGPYGQARSPDTETFERQLVKGAGILDVASGQVSQSFVDSIMSSPEKVAFYVMAIRYGGYQFGDILLDIKREEMKFKNDPNASKIRIIHPEMKRSEYINTAEGINAIAGIRQFIDPSGTLAGNINPDILKYGFDMPDSAFKILVPILNQDSPEYKTAVENVKASFYDLAMQQLQATSEQEKAVADSNMAKLKETLNRQYGILLSDNATAAWKQIETLGESYSQRGLQGSGMEGETVDNYLRAIRNKDSQNRQAKLSQEETDMSSFYKASATPQQIQALIAEDQAKGLPRDQWRAMKWGLVPSDDIVQKYSIENLKQMFPDSNDAQLQSYRDAVLDENGNYRSTIYSNYYSNLVKTQKEKKVYQEDVIEKRNLKEDERMRELVDKGASFSSLSEGDKKKEEAIIEANGGTTSTTGTITPPAGTTGTITPPADNPPPVDDSYKKSASDAVKNMGTGSGLTTGSNVSTDTAMTLARVMGANPAQLESLKKTLATYPTSSSTGAPAQTQSSSNQTPPKQYATLYDYYAANGGWNTWNSARRQADAKAAGISNYTGSETQNPQLLKYLRGY